MGDVKARRIVSVMDECMVGKGWRRELCVKDVEWPVSGDCVNLSV